MLTHLHENVFNFIYATLLEDLWNVLIFCVVPVGKTNLEERSQKTSPALKKAKSTSQEETRK